MTSHKFSFCTQQFLSQNNLIYYELQQKLFMALMHRMCCIQIKPAILLILSA